MLERPLAVLDRVIAVVLGAAMALVLPVSLLLFLQWPLRDLVQAYSREANDVAQLLFALYVAAAISYASRRGVHLATDALAHRYRAATRTRLARVASLCVLALVLAEPRLVWQRNPIELSPGGSAPKSEAEGREMLERQLDEQLQARPPDNEPSNEAPEGGGTK